MDTIYKNFLRIVSASWGEDNVMQSLKKRQVPRTLEQRLATYEDNIRNYAEGPILLEGVDTEALYAGLDTSLNLFMDLMADKAESLPTAEDRLAWSIAFSRELREGLKQLDIWLALAASDILSDKVAAKSPEEIAAELLRLLNRTAPYTPQLNSAQGSLPQFAYGDDALAIIGTCDCENCESARLAVNYGFGVRPLGDGEFLISKEMNPPSKEEMN